MMLVMYMLVHAAHYNSLPAYQHPTLQNSIQTAQLQAAHTARGHNGQLTTYKTYQDQASHSHRNVLRHTLPS